MDIKTLARFTVGDIAAIFQIHESSGAVQFVLIPSGLEAAVVDHRKYLNEPDDPALKGHELKPAWQIDSLVQVKLSDDAAVTGFGNGLTTRNSPTTSALKFKSQTPTPGGIVTELESPRGFRIEHIMAWEPEGTAIRFHCRFINDSSQPLTIESLSSFSLAGITPFAPDDAPGRLFLHRARSYWAGEGRFERLPIEQLHLEPSWVAVSAQSESFGQVGSMPVRRFFPFAAVEDSSAGVIWAAQLAWPGSWQMEVYRKDDFLQLSGGLADRGFGHWTKTVGPGESFASPEALVTCVHGDIQEACRNLTRAHRLSLPPVEADLPIIFNEWCTTWGQPTHGKLLALADRLSGSEVKYLVIDAGWALKPGTGQAPVESWRVDPARFPEGLRTTCDAIRKRGLIPGLWFEFEVVMRGMAEWDATEHLLHLDGRVLEAGARRFFDFRDPWVHRFLGERVIGLLEEAGIGYLKVDYNESIGIGCDGASSPGEGLRQHLEGVRAFFRRLRDQLPGLVVEICASGGHRLEPSMLELGAMASFSDAHETRDIPIIAGNVQRLIPARANQVWAVLRPHDDRRRLVYSLAATFLGRMCLSGDITALDDSQWETVVHAQRLYRRVWEVIANGASRRYGSDPSSYRHPVGWQAVLRIAQEGGEALAVIHTFKNAPRAAVDLTLPAGNWRVVTTLHTGPEEPVIQYGRLRFHPGGDFAGAVIHLANDNGT